MAAVAVRARQGPIDLLGRPCRRPVPNAPVRAARRRFRVWSWARRRTPFPFPDLEGRPARPSLTAEHQGPPVDDLAPLDRPEIRRTCHRESAVLHTLTPTE